MSTKQEIKDLKNANQAAVADEEITVTGSRIQPVSPPETETKQLKLNNLKQALYKYGGVQKQNLFTVTIKNATEFLNPDFEPRDLVFFCNRVALPGVSFFTTDNYSRYGVGVTTKMPYRASFQETNLSFMGDGRGNMLNFFERWTNKIINFTNAHDFAAPRPFVNEQSERLWEPGEVAYANDYKRDIVIELYDTSLNVVNEYTLYKCFPISVQDNQLAWSSVDDFMEINTIFSYTNWKSSSVFVEQADSSNLPGLSFLQKVLKLGSIATTFAAIGRPKNISDIIQIVNNANLIGLNSKNGLF